MATAREHELYKDKIEVSLDGRQIFYLFFGGAVIVGMVFVLGVMVGRRVEARGHVERAHVEAAIDPLAALDRLEGGAGLSFQTSLKGAEPAALPEVDKKIAEIAKAKEPEAKKPEKKEDKPKFTLQLSSFQDKGEADTFVQSVKTAGFTAYITEGSVDGKQYYRVRLGKYGTLEAANDAKADFEKSSKKSALVTKL
jgi:DedD protein